VMLYMLYVICVILACGPSHLPTPPTPLPLFHMTVGSLYMIDEAKAPNFRTMDGHSWIKRGGGARTVIGDWAVSVCSIQRTACSEHGALACLTTAQVPAWLPCLRCHLRDNLFACLLFSLPQGQRRKSCRRCRIAQTMA